ncbi:MAG: bifunctional demethylmenaquinone methyltransferase/2-methoxy-6-polyprenyl-1,4-benzoquinol methylase UbiE [Betaproteobacteria bacterium]|nr:bifunctional demethylmenaquinone methyltransferase/2-methoxy-6-polyprenyl-1,4-benzoquinol methylase UbiE [Betaproteobacteria bacterium]
MSEPTHFGFQTVAEPEKARRVAGVFDSVASRYDLMNDLMSLGLHRAWKRFAIEMCGVHAGHKVLDLAGGSGDLARALATAAGANGEVWLTDINGSMLSVGRDRMLDHGCMLLVAQCNAERLPFPNAYFDCVTVGFGLRNMTHKDRALAEMVRVLRPGGRGIVLEFSKIWKPLERAYDAYSFRVLPWLGHKIAGDAAAYQYLAESIRMHPDQDALKQLMRQCGFEDVEYWNLSAGVVVLHRGFKY